MSSANYAPRLPPPAASAPARRRSLPFPLAISLGSVCVLFVGALFIGGILAIVNASMRSSGAYELALATAQRDPAVVAALGTPLEPGWFTTGHIEVSGPIGNATLAIPVTGPRGEGRINVRAEKFADRWSLHALSVEVQGRAAPLDLLPSTSAPAADAP